MKLLSIEKFIPMQSFYISPLKGMQVYDKPIIAYHKGAAMSYIHWLDIWQQWGSAEYMERIFSKFIVINAGAELSKNVDEPTYEVTRWLIALFWVRFIKSRWFCITKISYNCLYCVLYE